MSSSPPCPRAPLLWLLLPFMAGLAAADACATPLPPALWLAAAAMLAGIAAWWALRPGISAHAGWGLSLAAAAALTGFAYLPLRQPHWHEISDRPPREVTLTLLVEHVYPPTPTARSVTGYGSITRSSALESDLPGRRVYFSATRKVGVAPQRAGRYAMRGVIESLTPYPARPGFDDYLANLGIRQKLTRGVVLAEETAPGGWASFVSRAADRLEAILRHGLAGQPAAASLYTGMLLGEKTALSPEQQDAFLRSGTFHIFSVSGLHVGVIAGAIYTVFSVLRIGSRTTVLLTLPILWLYVQITGAGYPALRAFIMIAFFLGGRLLRQPGNGLAVLSCAALATLLYDPTQLFSTGFQMSYSVVLALIAMGAPLAERWLARWKPFAYLPRGLWRWRHHRIKEAGRAVITSAAMCWVAFLASLPSSIGYFQVFSPGSLFANLLIIPLSSLAIISGFLSLLAGLPGLLSLSFLFNRAAAMLIIGMDWLLAHGTRLPGVSHSASFHASWVAPTALALASGLLLLCQAGRWARRYGGYWPPVVAALVLLLCATHFG